MPLTFPSHPGLVLPLWLAWPARYDAVALALGSMIPDLIDLPIGYATGRDVKLAHGLAGLVVVGIPAALAGVAALNATCARIVARLPAPASTLPDPALPLGGTAARTRGRIRPGSGLSARLDEWGERSARGVVTLARILAGRLGARPFRWRRSLAGVALGAASHLLFDLLTHSSFDWLRPWGRVDLTEHLPDAFSRPWLRLALPGAERSWGVGFYELAWLGLSGLGAALFAGCLWVGIRRDSWR